MGFAFLSSIGKEEYQMPKVRNFLATLAILIVASSPVLADPVYTETFDTDQGSFSIANGADPGSGWAADSACPPATSAPNGAGVLRWGAFADCFTYGTVGHIDVASSAATSTTGGCTLSFNYHLDYEEPVSFENADVEVSVDGGGGSPLLSLAAGQLVSAGSWLNASAPVPDGSVVVNYIGSTDDAAFNTGTGWSIDDVVIDCPVAGTPATSSWGVLALMMGISLAMAVALFRLRKQSVRG
jgi:hypothetical protein